MRLVPFGRGWTRVGIACSLFWVAAAGTFATVQFLSLSHKHAGWEDAQPTWSEVHNLLAVCSASPKAPITKCSMDTDHLAWLTVGPIVGGWILAIVFVLCYRWVRDGFRADKP